MAKVKPNGHIWGLEYNRYVCLSFSGNRTMFGWDIANSLFDLENSRSRLWPRSTNLMVTFEAYSSINVCCCFMAIGPYLTLKIQGQGNGQGQILWSHLRPRVQSTCLLFVSWQWGHFWLRYSKFHIWPWKFKVKVKTKITQNLIN